VSVNLFIRKHVFRVDSHHLGDEVVHLRADFRFHAIESSSEFLVLGGTSVVRFADFAQGFLQDHVLLQGVVHESVKFLHISEDTILGCLLSHDGEDEFVKFNQARSINIDRVECVLDVLISSRLSQELPSFVVFWITKFGVAVLVECVEGILQGHVHLIALIVLFAFGSSKFLHEFSRVGCDLLLISLLHQSSSASSGLESRELCLRVVHCQHCLLLRLLESFLVVAEESFKSVKVAVHLGHDDAE